MRDRIENVAGEQPNEAPRSYTRRSFAKMMGASCLALTAMNLGLGTVAFGDTGLEFPKPTGAVYDTVGGKKVLTCYSPSTVANMSEMLGLNNPSFYKVEYTAYESDISQSPTLGVWGSSWNNQQNAYLSNLVYRDAVGGEVDENYVAVLGSALQGFSQHSEIDDSIGGIPLFMKHRPKIMFFGQDEKWDSRGGTNDNTGADYVKVINGFDKDGDFYQEGDESYNPSFINARAYYGEKLGYMYSMWDLATEAERLIAADGNLCGRYGSVSDIAAQYEEFMLASQYAILRAISQGSTKRKTVAVIGGISDQTQGVTNGVDLATGRARLDKFDASTKDFASSTNWGTTTNYNVRYYHAAAALENCCDNVIDVVGVSDASNTDAPIIQDENGICWARPEALMQADAIIVRTQTTVTAIPGTDELYTILRQYGYTDQSQWPDIFTSNPTIPGYGASNSGQLFWWSAYLGFVYPEVINPVYMGAYCCEKFFHVASAHLEEAFQLLYGEFSLPKGYELSLAGYKADDLDEIFEKGLEHYLFYKESIDAKYANLVMTDGMSSWLTPAKQNQMGINETVFTDIAANDWYYNAVNYCAKAGIMTGYTDGSGHFGPVDNLTRGQAALILCRYYAPEEEGAANTSGMSDVADGSYYAGAVSWAIKQGIMSGYGAGSFGPDDELTREQLCIIIANVAHAFKGATITGANRSAMDAMPDHESVDTWAGDQVAWALNNKVISGVNNNGELTIMPLEPVNRATMAQVMKNAIENKVL